MVSQDFLIHLRYIKVNIHHILNHILNSFKIRHIKFNCCFAHILDLDQNKVFLFALSYRQFRNAYFPIERTGTGTQKRSGLPLSLQFSELFRKLPNGMAKPGREEGADNSDDVERECGISQDIIKNNLVKTHPIGRPDEYGKQLRIVK